MKIDSHHHFWNYDPVTYDWIDDSMRAIQRDFLPEDLLAEIASVGVDGVVSVQARQSLEETQWLLDFADKNEFIKGVVGWVNLLSPDISADLERFAENPKFKAVRHVIQGEPDENFILQGDFNRGIRELVSFSLVYDILILERHLPQTIQFVDAHPNQIFVLDHIAKPPIREGHFEPWNQKIRELAKRPNVYCKVSGMATEADFTNWSEAQLQPYFDTVLEAFGAQRLMYGSDWPVCLVACSYTRWHDVVSSWVRDLSLHEQARIFGGTAEEIYEL
jgi:L-fuconolactonase